MMLTRIAKPVRLGAMLGLLSIAAAFAAAQETGQQPAAGTTASKAEDAARKAQILDSPEWRRAMFEFKEWLSAQKIYDAKQVQEIKDRFNHRVAAMSAKQLEFLLADMQSKFQILNSPQAEEARAWLASYLAVMSDKKRAEVLKEMPNVVTMTAAQLNQELMKIEQKRATLEREQASFQRSQQELASAQIQRDREAQQTFVRERDRGPSTTYSPYRSPSDVNAHLNQGRVGSGTRYYVGPWGGVGMSFSATSF